MSEEIVPLQIPGDTPTPPAKDESAAGAPVSADAPAQTEAPAPADDRISIDDFARIQLRVGQIVEAEKVKGSRKLIKLMVDIGSEIRQVVAGIAEAYEPEALINKKIVLVANLKPAKLMGIESNGMIVAATADGKPVLTTFTENVPNGALLR